MATHSFSHLAPFLDDALPNYQKIELIAGDASFRKYYRVFDHRQSYILMDAPPPHENKTLFAFLTNAFAQAGLNVPEIIYDDDNPQYLLLSDFGDNMLFDALSIHPKKHLKNCLNTLFDIQTKGGQHITELPEYSSDLLQKELGVCTTWFIDALLQCSLDNQSSKKIKKLYETLVNKALNQPKVWVHRDFHSRNLMQLSDSKIGIIDYQDAVYGPITYDLASILKDCYIVYDKDLISEQLMNYYHQLIASDTYWKSYEDFVSDFDLIALQRHIKVLGVFARLYLRDNKPQYLDNLPTVMNYILETLAKYPQLQSHLSLFKQLNKEMHIVLAKRLS